MIEKLPPWEKFLKKMVIAQLGKIENKKILDFGSGEGVTADYFAKDNDVIAIEPSEDILKGRHCENAYQQLVGSTEELQALANETFDLIICHNVLEYVPDRACIVNQFYRLLKMDGLLSIVKHNRAGRVMQMAVLLNDFDSANSLLDGNDGMASRYGAIHYYDDKDICSWCEGLYIAKALGIRTFWDLQQNQDIQKELDWQKKMLDIEMRVSDMDAYRDIAFFHHLFITKKRGLL